MIIDGAHNCKLHPDRKATRYIKASTIDEIRYLCQECAEVIQRIIDDNLVIAEMKG